MTTDPSVISKETQYLRDSTVLAQTLMGGTRAMRAKGETYLPRPGKESEKDYLARLNMSFLFPGYERTIGLLSGQVFAKPIIEQDKSEIPENVDLDGNDINRFSRRAFENGLIEGSGVLMVDVPPLPRDDETGEERSTTAAEDKETGRRPYYVFINQTRVLDMRFQADKCVMIRFEETVKVPDPKNRFAENEVNQIKVIYPGSWEIYRQGDKGEWAIYQIGSLPWKNEVPAVGFYFGRKISKFTTRPPLSGLAELNQEHWISASDQRNVLHVARVPILFGKMLIRDGITHKVEIAANSMISSDNEKGDLKYVEHSGQAIESGWKDLERIETQMELFGLALIMQQRTGNITATERAITTAQTAPFLGMCVKEFQDALNTLDRFAAEIEGREPYSYVINSDFSLSLGSLNVSTIYEAFKIRLLDRATVVKELIRRGEISDETDITEILAGLENDSRQTGNIGAAGVAFLG